VPKIEPKHAAYDTSRGWLRAVRLAPAAARQTHVAGGASAGAAFNKAATQRDLLFLNADEPFGEIRVRSL